MALTGKIETLELLVTNLKEQIAKYVGMEAISDEIKKSYEKSIADFQKQFDRLVRERDAAVRRAWWYAFGAAVIASLLTFFATKE